MVVGFTSHLVAPNHHYYLWNRIYSNFNVWTHKSSLTPSIFIEVPAPKRAVLYVCARGITFVSFYDFDIDFGIVQTLVYLVFNFITKGILNMDIKLFTACISTFIHISSKNYLCSVLEIVSTSSFYFLSNHLLISAAVNHHGDLFCACNDDKHVTFSSAVSEHHYWWVIPLPAIFPLSIMFLSGGFSKLKMHYNSLSFPIILLLICANVVIFAWFPAVLLHHVFGVIRHILIKFSWNYGMSINCQTLANPSVSLAYMTVKTLSFSSFKSVIFKIQLGLCLFF